MRIFHVGRRSSIARAEDSRWKAFGLQSQERQGAFVKVEPPSSSSPFRTVKASRRESRRAGRVACHAPDFSFVAARLASAMSTSAFGLAQFLHPFYSIPRRYSCYCFSLRGRMCSLCRLADHSSLERVAIESEFEEKFEASRAAMPPLVSSSRSSVDSEDRLVDIVKGIVTRENEDGSEVSVPLPHCQRL